MSKAPFSAIIALLLSFAIQFPAFGQPMPPPGAPPGPPAAPLVQPGPKVDGLELTPADPTVKQPTATTRFLTVTATTADPQPLWIVIGSSAVQYEIRGKTVIIGIPDAGNQVLVYAIAVAPPVPSQPPQKLLARTVITVDGMQAPAPPDPGPQPPRPPAVVKGLNIIIIDDVAARAQLPYIAQIINSSALRSTFKKAGHKFVVLDKADDDVTTFNLAKWVKSAGGAPCLLIQLPDTGAIAVAVPCPLTPTDLITVVNKFIASR